ncbi:hypothetical protein RHGRI_037410 [Rhododendron griersonianum]|uniref:Uncharacterized protein n=1 Tax=Rhododendron griersonianum TaxID=479676 RepID=A0AAV6HVK1_9ERIC|nr:hypothetical protein RHGRI_037410 [Rhododendron griersonianum]
MIRYNQSPGRITERSVSISYPYHGSQWDVAIPYANISIGGVNKAEESQLKTIVAGYYTFRISDGLCGCKCVRGNAKLQKKTRKEENKDLKKWDCTVADDESHTLFTAPSWWIINYDPMHPLWLL